MGKHGQGTHCTKMGADSLAENSPNTPEFICPKFLDFNEKRLHRASVVRGSETRSVSFPEAGSQILTKTLNRYFIEKLMDPPVQ
jgi:hypothetical protein